MQKKKQILLSFDVEEFDTPLEYGKNIPLDEQFRYSHEGLLEIIKLLNMHDIKATFFTTANFALRYPKLIKEISDTHEIASHGFYHSNYREEDLALSKQVLEDITGKKIYGYRMARMMPIDNKAIREAGYHYNASLHPTFIPGRYNNFNKPRVPFIADSLLQIPASVTPVFRFPVFWLSFKNFPLAIIKTATRRIINKDGFANFYFHPWEFTPINNKKELGLPFYISKLSGNRMLRKLDCFIKWAKLLKMEFCTYSDFAQSIK